MIPTKYVNGFRKDLIVSYWRSWHSCSAGNMKKLTFFRIILKLLDDSGKDKGEDMEQRENKNLDSKLTSFGGKDGYRPRFFLKAASYL